MAELTPSTREAARRLGVSDTTMHKAERTGRIAREPDGQWDITKTRARMLDTADPQRSPLSGGANAEGTPFARLKVAQLAWKVEAQRLALDESKGRLLNVATANATIDEIASTMRDALLNWPARASGNTMLSREFLCSIEGDGEPSSAPPQQTMALIFSPYPILRPLPQGD
jgi:hypothetical protein